MSNKETVCAVVVTYNRKELLIECLEGLLKQTRLIDSIYLIDNFSNDGTPELLKNEGFIDELPPEELNEPWEKEFNISNSQLSTLNSQLPIHYVRMNENTGGAGGFYEGVKRAYEQGYDWLWLMDDDTIPLQDACKVLLDDVYVVDDYYSSDEVGFALSKVFFDDEHVHMMNLPQLTPFVNGKPFNQLEEKGLLIVPAGSFVSMLINKNAIKQCGFPIKEFFIWGDDIEYSSRITEAGFLGIYSRKSIVIHKTKENYSSNIFEDNIKNLWKYRYGIRNALALKKRKGYIYYSLNFLYSLIIMNLKLLKFRKDNKIAFIKTNTFATIKSLIFNVNYEK